jgi:hypothetical protein
MYNMRDSSKQEWIRSILLDVSLLGEIKSEERNRSDELELQHVSLHEVIPYIRITEEGSKPRKRFQARTSHRRGWERRRQFYRQEKLIETVQRKRSLELRRSFSDEVQHAMGILHVQSLLLQTLAREENRARGLGKANSELLPVDEMIPRQAILPDSTDLLRDVGSAVATLWM